MDEEEPGETGEIEGVEDKARRGGEGDMRYISQRKWGEVKDSIYGADQTWLGRCRLLHLNVENVTGYGSD